MSTRPKYSIGRPHPEHVPDVYRSESIGMTPIRPQRPVYGTRMHCSCGWQPDRSNFMGGRVSNAAPSTKEGKGHAQDAYTRHLQQSGIETEPQDGDRELARERRKTAAAETSNEKRLGKLKIL